MEPRNPASPAPTTPKATTAPTTPKAPTPKATTPKTPKTPKATTAPTLSAAKRKTLVSTIADPAAKAKAKTTARRTLREAGYGPDGKALAGSRSAAPAKTSARVASGPSPERAKLAKTVAGLRAKGAKWNEIAASTGKSEPTLAKLRKDVRAGAFASISPVASRVPSDAF